VGQVNSGVKERLRKLYGFMLETRGHSVMTTVRIACNKAIYIFGRAAGRDSQAGLVHAEWYWARHPFSLRRKVLWSSALKAWFVPEDESAIECMLHMPKYEPIDWVDPREGEYFLDGGGYVGWYTIQASRAVRSSGRVVVLEPDVVNRGQLERNVALNELDNVHILRLALWSHSGNVRWQHAEEPVWHQVTEQGKDRQRAVSIDELVCDLRLPRLDWIKLDIEGAEVNALLGASKTLRDYGPKSFIEIHETAAAVSRILFNAGYRVMRECYDQPPDRHGWILAQRP